MTEISSKCPTHDDSTISDGSKTKSKKKNTNSLTVPASVEGAPPKPCYGATPTTMIYSGGQPKVVVGGKGGLAAIVIEVPKLPDTKPNGEVHNNVLSAGLDPFHAPIESSSTYRTAPTSKQNGAALNSQSYTRPTSTTMVGGRRIISKTTQAAEADTSNESLVNTHTTTGRSNRPALKTTVTSQGVTIVTATHLAPPPDYSVAVNGEPKQSAQETGHLHITSTTTQPLPTFTAAAAVAPSQVILCPNPHMLARHRSRCAVESGGSITFAESQTLTSSRRRTPATAASAVRVHQDPTSVAQKASSALNVSTETDVSTNTTHTNPTLSVAKSQEARFNLSSVNVSTATTTDETESITLNCKATEEVTPPQAQSSKGMLVVVDEGLLDAPMEESDLGNIRPVAPRMVTVKSSPKKPSNTSMTGTATSSTDLENDISPAPTTILLLNSNSVDNASNRSTSTAVSAPQAQNGGYGVFKGIELQSMVGKQPSPAEEAYRSTSPPPPPLRTGSPIDVLAAAGVIRIFRTATPLVRHSEESGEGARDGKSPSMGSDPAVGYKYRYAHNPYGNTPINFFGLNHSQSFRDPSPSQLKAPVNESFGCSPCHVASSMDEMYQGNTLFAAANTLFACAAAASSPIGPRPQGQLSQYLLGAHKPSSTPATPIVGGGRLFAAPPPLPPASASRLAKSESFDEHLALPRPVSPTAAGHNPYFQPPSQSMSPVANATVSSSILGTEEGIAMNCSPAATGNKDDSLVTEQILTTTSRRVVAQRQAATVTDSNSTLTTTGRRVVSGTSVASIQRPLPPFHSNLSSSNVAQLSLATSPIPNSASTSGSLGRRYVNARPLAVPGGAPPTAATTPLVPQQGNVVVARMA